MADFLSEYGALLTVGGIVIGGIAVSHYRAREGKGKKKNTWNEVMQTAKAPKLEEFTMDGVATEPEEVIEPKSKNGNQGKAKPKKKKVQPVKKKDKKKEAASVAAKAVQRAIDRAEEVKEAEAAAAQISEPAPSAAVDTSGMTKAQKKRLRQKQKKAAAAQENQGIEDGWEEVKTRRQPIRRANADLDATDGTSSGPAIVKDEVLVDPRHYSTIIGSGGTTLNALRELTGTDISVPDKGSSDKWVTIKGPPEGVAMAKQAITELAEKGYSSVTDPDTCEGKVVVPQASRSTLIGPGGAHIKAITAHTGAQIKLPKRGDTQSGNDAVVIIGSRDEVREAKLLIKELLETGITQVTHPGMIIGRMAFPFERVGWLVGHAGHTVKSIQGNTKTKITIPKTAGQMVVIVGTQEGIAAAIKEITRVITPPEPEPEPTVDELRNDKNNEWSHVPQYDW